MFKGGKLIKNPVNKTKLGIQREDYDSEIPPFTWHTTLPHTMDTKFADDLHLTMAQGSCDAPLDKPPRTLGDEDTMPA